MRYLPKTLVTYGPIRNGWARDGDKLLKGYRPGTMAIRAAHKHSNGVIAAALAKSVRLLAEGFTIA